MRTKEQIDNLRGVLILTYGDIGLLFSDEQVNAWADKMQDHINNYSKSTLVRSWTIRTGFIKNHEYTIENMLVLKPEKENVQATEEQI